MRKLLTALLLILAVSCTKSSKDDDPEFEICGPNYPSWLKEMTKGLSNCECPVAFFVGSHNGQVVFVNRTTSAWCCGLDMVYDSKGNALFYTMSAEEYKKLLSEITGLKEIWRCSRPTK